jgi:hypothetical protein
LVAFLPDQEQTGAVECGKTSRVRRRTHETSRLDGGNLADTIQNFALRAGGCFVIVLRLGPINEKLTTLG